MFGETLAIAKNLSGHFASLSQSASSISDSRQSGIRVT